VAKGLEISLRKDLEGERGIQAAEGERVREASFYLR
jgi:hypothetical protein